MVTVLSKHFYVIGLVVREVLALLIGVMSPSPLRGFSGERARGGRADTNAPFPFGARRSCFCLCHSPGLLRHGHGPGFATACLLRHGHGPGFAASIREGYSLVVRGSGSAIADLGGSGFARTDLGRAQFGCALGCGALERAVCEVVGRSRHSAGGRVRSRTKTCPVPAGFSEV